MPRARGRLIEVIEYSRDDLTWPFNDATPHLRIGRTKYGHRVAVDPTPAYAHDAALARETLDRVAAAFPIDWPVAVCLLPAECTSRTNGATSVEQDYDYDAPLNEKGNYPASTFGTIFLSAKRIPIHPAMTRYLVAHEYGHVIEEWLNARDGKKIHDSALMKSYSELRGGEINKKPYGAGVWHTTCGEVFANDFRLLVCGIEPEFWPHPGIERPENVPAVQDWWATRVAEILPPLDRAA